MNDVDWEGIFFGLGVLVLGTVIWVAVRKRLDAIEQVMREVG